LIEFLLYWISDSFLIAKSKFGKLAFATTIIVVFAVQGSLYVYADATKTTNILSLASRVPFYQAIEVRSYTAGTFMTAQAEAESHLNNSDFDFSYDSRQFELADDFETPDIFFVAMDSVRNDVIKEDVAPNISAFASKSNVFSVHNSGGNQTRHGVFSLFYGIPASYWKNALRTKTPPVLILALQRRGYDVQVFSSANLDHPEFKETVFSSLSAENIHDKYDGIGPVQRDIQAASDFNKFVITKSSRPKFGFLFLDGTHGPYSYTDENRKFVPDQESYFISYNPTAQVKAIKNQYLNGIYQADTTLKETLQILNSKSRKKNNTIIVITSDHGEEFLEHGFRGHCSAFTPEQVNVPLITRGLTKEVIPTTHSHRTTHEDLVYTLLGRIGVENPARHTTGGNIMDDQREFALACGWDQCAVISDQHVTVFGTESYNAMKVDRLDGNYESKGVSNETSPFLSSAFRIMTKYFRTTDSVSDLK
jgi:membrane-anchored protein YejM (alkaline phosphatase superfamily)